MSSISVASFCRLDDACIAHLRNRPARSVLLTAAATITVGASAYGFSLGIWRAPEQALYSAIKLPLLFFAIAGSAAFLGGLLAILLRSKLSLAQTAASIVVGFAIMSAVLGALTPIVLLLQAAVPPPDPSVLGLRIDDPRVRPSLDVAQVQVFFHVVVVAIAGCVGVLRQRQLLARLGVPVGIARRVILVWMAVELAVGSQWSWLLRPFFGRPHLPPSWTCEGLLSGNFFEEVVTNARSIFGQQTLGVLAGSLTVGALLVLHRLFFSLVANTKEFVTFELSERIVRINNGSRVIDVEQIAGVTLLETEVSLQLCPDDTFARETLVMRCSDESNARELAYRLERALVQIPDGPFRTSAG